MPIFASITEKLLSYVNPRKTQKRRDKPFKAPITPAARSNSRPTPQKAADVRSSVSPATRVKNWRFQTPINFSYSEIYSSPASLIHRIGTPSRNLEGDTLVKDIFQDANEDTKVVDEATYNPKDIDLNNKVEAVDIKARELRALGWREDAIAVFSKLSMRGFEPLMPLGWHRDFETFPWTLYTRNKETAFIKETYGQEFRAMKAFRQLVDIGPRVRDIVLSSSTHRTADQIVYQGSKAYLKWALKDGRLDPRSNIPLIIVERFPEDMPPEPIAQALLEKFHAIADEWREVLRVYPSVEGSTESGSNDDLQSIEPPSEVEEYVEDLPTIYGLVCSHMYLGFVAYDPMASNPEIIDIGSFDMGLKMYDVWNSLAIAIFIIHCRNQMMALKQYMPIIHFMDEEDDDPDA